ncbi:MAG: glycosyltransferase family 4 protein [Rhodospirillales bacterium]|nr:glycosyltransferase family 4 protein [Rhodospirillales bacterium]
MLMVTLVAAPLTGFATWALSRMVLELLVSGNVMDRPNERSSHDRPVPRGGGIALMGMVIPSWLFLAVLTHTFGQVWPVIAAATVLAVLSFVDDLRNLPAMPRFAAHVAAVVLGLLLLPDNALLFDGMLPLWADRIVVGLAWLWFINLFNFMDGIDGITGVETITIAGGLAVAIVIVVAGAGGDWSRAPLAAVMAGAAAGFLVLNWHPARLFLGDVGSVPLGYLLGWLLVWTACVRGLWWLALLLPLTYWADATTTLLWRTAKGDRIWRAHRSHAYQAAVQAGARHDTVSCVIAAVNAGLVALALLALVDLVPVWLALGAGAVLTGLLLWYLRSGLGRQDGSS